MSEELLPRTSNEELDTTPGDAFAGAPVAPPAISRPMASTLTPEALLAKLQSCTKISRAPYANDVGGAATVDVCGLGNVVFWKADMDIDCDGKSSAACNSSTDPWFQAQTATTDSRGRPLDAATLPFIVVPGVSSRWNYNSSNITLGSVGVVIYNGKMTFGIVGDVGPSAGIGEASYAMAKSLGIDPNPRSGGVASGVTYMVFAGADAVVTANEDHAEAVTLGTALAQQFLDRN